jgi:hypothetical protein
VLCVHFTRIVTDTRATLNTGGWLSLTLQGLPPCQKYQAYLAYDQTHFSAFHGFCFLSFFTKYCNAISAAVAGRLA